MKNEDAMSQAEHVAREAWHSQIGMLMCEDDLLSPPQSSQEVAGYIISRSLVGWLRTKRERAMKRKARLSMLVIAGLFVAFFYGPLRLLPDFWTIILLGALLFASLSIGLGD